LSNETPASTPYPLEEAAFSAYSIRVPRRRFQHDIKKHVVLFVLTVLTATGAGAFHYADFLEGFSNRNVPINWFILLNGLWYSAPALLILGAHEFGHYFMCRRYNVDATLPYFIPAPLPVTGTLGAVIRIREPFPTRKALFDIAIGGPIAGFLVLLPFLFAGMKASEAGMMQPGSGLGIGAPLLFRWVADLVFGPLPVTHAINLHPVVFAAWFGMLATAINLLPFGQLDGGHLSYATLGRWAAPVSIATVSAAVVMTVLVSPSWIVMTLIMVVMLALFGPHHPRVLDEHEPLGAGRYVVAILAAIIFAICFTATPLFWYELTKVPGT
jgi:membrane-associated protease RseP (regulator of RpoE activity)